MNCAITIKIEVIFLYWDCLFFPNKKEISGDYK